MNREILVAVVVTLIVDEATGLSRWSAVRLARWAAKHLYLADTERATKRAEEWDALITKSIPTNIAALFFALGLVAATAACIAARRAAVLVAAVGRFYAALPGAEQAMRLERRTTEHRQASLSLLKAAGELQLLVADTMQLNLDELHVHLPGIRSLAANTQLQAANVALLAPDSLAVPAEELAAAAALLANAIHNTSASGELTVFTSEFAEFEQSRKAFLRAAITVSRELASHDTVVISGQAQRG